MLPSKERALELLEEALTHNPGPWGDHSRVAAHCASAIAARCEGLDPEKAYVLGLLHDIGRRFGVRHMGHVSDGYAYMTELGCDEAAQICLTHSFCDETIDGYIGRIDTTPEETRRIVEALKRAKITDYDRLIRLCDALAGSEGVLNVEERMADVKNRYGWYPQEKWDYNLGLKAYFEALAGGDLYEIVAKDVYRPRYADEALARKMGVLLKVARALNGAGLTWAVGASLMLYLYGIVGDFHDVDLMIMTADVETVRALLGGMGTPMPSEPNARYRTKHFLEFVIDGVDVDVMAGFAIACEDGVYDGSLRPEQIEKVQWLDDVPIPMQAPALWKRYYARMGRPEKVEKIEAYLKRKAPARD